MKRTIQLSRVQRAQLRSAFLAGLSSPDNAICCGKNARAILAMIVDERDVDRLMDWCYGALGCTPAGRAPMDANKRDRYLVKIDALDELSADTDDERAIDLDGN